MKEVKRLINKGIDVNIVDYDKRSGLHIAASKGLINMVKFLLNFPNINVNPID
jgi:ankyrin repeat protein